MKGPKYELKEVKPQRCRVGGVSQRRWLEFFKDYDCIIDYHKGKANVVANALSKKTMSTLALQFSRWRITPDGVLLA